MSQVFPNDPLRGTIQLPTGPFQVSWDIAKRYLRPAPGICYVEMAPYEEKRGAILLSDETKQRERADCGFVLACWFEREKEGVMPWREMEIRPGNKVLVEPYKGTWLQSAQFGPYKAQGWVRVYGLASGNYDEVHFTDWRDAILAVIDEKNHIRATGDWLFIKKEKLRESEGGVLLTDRSQKQSGIAKIVTAGASAQEKGYAEGQTIQFPPGLTYDAGMYDASHVKEFGLDDAECYSFLKCQNVLAVIQ